MADVNDDDFDHGPPVCGGCFAVGDEPCAEWCPDARREERENHEREWAEYGDDWDEP